MSILQFKNTEVMDLVNKRTEYLKLHPELLPLQEEIEISLKKAGKSQLNRCAVIQHLLIAELKKLDLANKEVIKNIHDLTEAVNE